MTRRAVLRAGAVTGLVGLAGCRTNGSDDSGSTGDETSVFRSVVVDGQHLVVRLREDADVSEVTLINPDGSLYGRREIATGVTTVRFQLVELKLGSSEHYTPGGYELIADGGDTEASRTLNLRPELHIRDVRQYETNDQPETYGHLAVLVENTGTAPTWIYDIAYSDPPRYGAKDELGDDQGIPHLKKPEDVKDLLLYPGDEQLYVELIPSLEFDKDNKNSCLGTIETTLLIGTGSDKTIQQRLRLNVGGRSISTSATGDFVCSDVTVNQLGSSDSDEASRSGSD